MADETKASLRTLDPLFQAITDDFRRSPHQAAQLHPTFDRILAEHLGLGGPKLKLSNAQMIEFLRDKADDECPADDAFMFREIADRLVCLQAITTAADNLYHARAGALTELENALAEHAKATP